MYRKLNGYMTKYAPDHPKAMKGTGYEGYVYEHILVAEDNLGRHLQPGEEVHHLDRNRSNNASYNIIVLLKSEHMRLHRWLSKVEVLELLPIPPHNCPVCNQPINNPRTSHCSHKCSSIARRKVYRPTKEDLKKDIDTMSWVAVGRKYGVSDNAVRKWARTYGIL